MHTMTKTDVAVIKTHRLEQGVPFTSLPFMNGTNKKKPRNLIVPCLTLHTRQPAPTPPPSPSLDPCPSLLLDAARETAVGALTATVREHGEPHSFNLIFLTTSGEVELPMTASIIGPEHESKRLIAL